MSAEEVKRLRAELAQAKREYRDAMEAVALHAETIGLLQTLASELRAEGLSCQAIADKLNADAATRWRR